MCCCKLCSTSRAEPVAGARRKASISSRAAMKGWPCLPENSGMTDQILFGAEVKADCSRSRVAAWAGGRSTRVMTAASRPRFRISLSPTCRELNCPREGSGLTTRSAPLAKTTGRRADSFLPATTSTKSQVSPRERMVADRNVSGEAWEEASLPGVIGGQGSRALSVPMREDSPAARIRAAKLGERGMLRTIAESAGESQRIRGEDDPEKLRMILRQGFGGRFVFRMRFLEPAQVRQRGRGLPAHGDQFGSNGNGDLFGCDGADIETDGGVHSVEKVRRKALVAQGLENLDHFALRSDHADIAGSGLHGPAQEAHVVAVAASHDH